MLVTLLYPFSKFLTLVSGKIEISLTHIISCVKIREELRMNIKLQIVPFLNNNAVLWNGLCLIKGMYGISYFLTHVCGFAVSSQKLSCPYLRNGFFIPFPTSNINSVY